MNAVEKTIHYENMVRQEWTNNATIDAWDKWAEEQAIHCRPLTDAVMQHARLEPGLRVLDLASGVGQPAFSIARTVLPQGQVVATDLSQGMLDVASRNAVTEGVANIEFEVADAHDLPFADQSFDRVVSRLGLMYFWDIGRAISEIHRVLKPGGVASFVVWGTDEQNAYFGTILAPFAQRKAMPVLPDDAPTPTRFSDVSALADLFREQGFQSVSTRAYCEPLPWPGDPKSLYEHFYDMAVPFQPYLDSFSEEELNAVVHDIEQGFAPVFDGSYTRAKASFNAISVVR